MYHKTKDKVVKREEHQTTDYGLSANSETKRHLTERLLKSVGRCGRATLAAACIYGGGVAGVATLNNLAPVETSAGPFEGEVTMSPLPTSGGGTRIETSIGSTQYPTTHQGSTVIIKAKIKDTFHPKSAFGKNGSIDEIEQTKRQINKNIPEVTSQLIMRTAAANVAGGLLGAVTYLGLSASAEQVAASKRRNSSKKAAASYLALVLGVGLVPYTIQPMATKNPNFSKQVRLTGLIAEGQKYSQNYQLYSEQLRSPSAEFFALNDIIDQLSKQPTMAQKPDVCLYIGSDPHGEGYRVLQTLANYDSSLGCRPITVISGDFSDWGAQFEVERPAITDLSRLPGAKIAVNGNHDSKYIMDAVAAEPGVNVLDNQLLTVDKQLSVLGITEPAFTPDDQEHQNTAPENYQNGKKLAKTVKPGDNQNNQLIIVAHEPAALNGYLENLPKDSPPPLLVIAGHTHNLKISQKYAGVDTIYVNPGTVSGAGIRLVDPETKKQSLLSAVSVHLKHNTSGWQVIRISQLEEDLRGQNKSFTSQVINSSDN